MYVKVHFLHHSRNLSMYFLWQKKKDKLSWIPFIPKKSRGQSSSLCIVHRRKNYFLPPIERDIWTPENSRILNWGGRNNLIESNHEIRLIISTNPYRQYSLTLLQDITLNNKQDSLPPKDPKPPNLSQSLSWSVLSPSPSFCALPTPPRSWQAYKLCKIMFCTSENGNHPPASAL